MVYKKKIPLVTILKIFLIFFAFYLFFRLIKDFRSSLFLNYKDRINLIFYQEQPVFVSIGRKDKVHYLIQFNPEIKISVPGGYGYYKIGALGKLVYLEKKPEIIQKAFSENISLFIDYFFIPQEQKIYSLEGERKDEIRYPNMTFRQLFSLGYKTNTNIFDRVWLLMFFLTKRGIDYNVISPETYTKKDFFQSSDFFSRYQGFFYRQTFRLEKKTVQVMYNNFKIAKSLGRMIEGEGIRIVDFTQSEKERKEECLVIENSEKPSQTAIFLADKLSCLWKKGEVNLADINLILSQELEKKWE